MKDGNLFEGGWKDYFTISNRLTKRLLKLFIILFILESGTLVYLLIAPGRKALQGNDNFKAEAASFFTVDKESVAATEDNEGNSYSEDKPEKATVRKTSDKKELFLFNPNNLPESEWKRLGFSEKQIHVIKNYESKGGKFHTKADVKKMYSISEKEYDRIEAYIVIPPPVQAKDTASKKGNGENKSFSKPTTPYLIVDLNAADTMELQTLYGIGPVKARIIYNYREKLGGFYSINQLHEVWGIDDTLFENLKPHLVLGDTTQIRKKNLNANEPAELKHPYINYNLANAIVNYRKQHGAYSSLEELHKIPLVTDDLYSKVSHYLEIKN